MKIQVYQVSLTFILLLTLKHIAKNMFDVMFFPKKGFTRRWIKTSIIHYVLIKYIHYTWTSSVRLSGVIIGSRLFQGSKILRFNITNFDSSQMLALTRLIMKLGHIYLK